MRWQRTARLAIAAFVIVFAGIVIATMRQRTAAPEPVREIARTDRTAAVENPGGANFRKTEDGRLVFQLVAKRHLMYPDGRNTLSGVQMTLPDRGGKTVTIAADEAELTKPPDKELGTAVFTGNVRLNTDDGIEVRAGKGIYDDATGVLEVPGPVEFTRGRMSGSGVGATYDRNSDVLWLRDRARITVSPDTEGRGRAVASAGSAGLARAENHIRLSRTARIDSDGRTMAADDITILLKPDGNTVEQAQLRGRSRLTEPDPNARSMSARDIDLTYGPDGRTLQSARLLEQAVVDLPGAGGAPGRRITGRTIEMTMGPDGSTLTQLSANDGVQLDLPAQGDAPAKRIRSHSLHASGPPDAGLQHASFEGQVEYTETREKRGAQEALNRVARSQRLIVATQAGLGEIDQADFRGRFRFSDGTQVTAEAPRALYHVDRDRIDLSAYEKEPGPTPFVNDDRSLVEAHAIQLFPAGRKITAEGAVKSTVRPGKGRETTNGGNSRDAKAGDQTRMPVILKRDRPVYVTSDKLVYDGVAEAAYSGRARLWQDESQSKIDAATIVLNDRTGNLTARTNVSTSMLLEDLDPKTKEKRVTPTHATSDVLVYDDAKRLAVYTGTRERQAHMKGVHGDVTADRIDVYLREGGGELERAEAHGAVTVKEGARIAKGDRLEYTASSDTYVMTGKLVEAIERETAQSCKRLLGTTLTFQRSVGTISADANGIPVNSERVPCPAESRD